MYMYLSVLLDAAFAAEAVAPLNILFVMKNAFSNTQFTGI